ncbi:Acyl-CoA dehydrogenase [Desulfuromusa kysingii]|uniref:Acyl-CoA dehydrogenase n=1 Tax=Desulfuromusa kysingii TaxID=37625 RepID=A0A1H3Y634_9BACT|nr:acyl-CoA dehydrogenase family protein [Desulfuromusa kysingii]SEA06551.1 Acyl-CoA dehydrogenase [Desulfuromusa kysingii]
MTVSATSTNTNAYKPFAQFIEEFKIQLKHLFYVRSNIDQLSTKRGMPPFMLREIMSSNPLATYIPTEYGGRGGHIHEGLALTAAASYQSLPLALGFGINWALFLQPTGKYGQEEIKPAVFNDFLRNRKMGGLMITEPDFGSDALHMKSSYTYKNGQYHIQGTKHWAGLTGWADYWLLTARHKNAAGDLKRDIDFFICDANSPEQNIEVEEFYENLGIYLLPYGRNRIDVKVPAIHKLQPKSTGIKMMLDLLHRSRMQFPGMGMGFLQRMLDEAVQHCQQRFVGGKSLFHYDQVQQRISRIQSAYTVCSAMCLNSSQKAGVENNLAPHGLEANAVKTYLTDLMQSSAQSLLQLVGAKGYRLNHIAGRAIVDSRPFQIFEGSNDILYIQIAETIQKQMQKAKQQNLFQFLYQHELTQHAAERLKKLFDFNLNPQLPQRKLTELGCIISRVVAMNLVLKLATTGFKKALIDDCLNNINQEVSSLMGLFTTKNSTAFIDNYSEAGSWFDCFTNIDQPHKP